MKMINMECPKCNAPLEIDKNREFTFCPYCGTKIMLDDEAIIKKYDVSFTNKSGVEKKRIREENVTIRQKESHEAEIKRREIELREREIELEEKKFKAKHPIKSILTSVSLSEYFMFFLFIIAAILCMTII